VIAVVAVALASLVAGAADERSVAQEPSPAPNSKLVRAVQADREDAGQVSSGQSAIRRMRLQNIADVPLELRVVGTTCGCTRLEIAPSVVAPGGFADLVLAVSVAPQPGEQRQQATLEVKPEGSDPSRRERFQLGIRYHAREECELFPRAIERVVVQGERVTIREWMRWLDAPLASPQRIRSVGCSLPMVVTTTVEYPAESVGVIAAGAELAPPTAGFYQGVLTISTDMQTQGTIDVPVALHVLPRWRGTPGGVLLVGSSMAAVKLSDRAPQLDPRPPARAVVPTGIPLSAVLTDEAGIVEVKVSTSAEGGQPWGCTVDLKDAQGETVGRIPVSYLPSLDSVGSKAGGKAPGAPQPGARPPP
jgi:hypothetical protein